MDWDAPTYEGEIGRTHANVADAEVAVTVAEDFIIPTERLFGDMRKSYPYVPR